MQGSRGIKNQEQRGEGKVVLALNPANPAYPDIPDDDSVHRHGKHFLEACPHGEVHRHAAVLPQHADLDALGHIIASNGAVLLQVMQGVPERAGEPRLLTPAGAPARAPSSFSSSFMHYLTAKPTKSLRTLVVQKAMHCAAWPVRSMHVYRFCFKWNT